MVKACKTCKMILGEDSAACPNCAGKELTTKYSGQIVVFNPEKSEIAGRMGFKAPGRYAVRTR